MSTHTPGPWSVSSHPKNEDAGHCASVRRTVDGPDGVYICSIWYREKPYWVSKAGKKHPLGKSFLVSEEAIANASLIAAAPDLLAALEECAHELSFQCTGSSGHNAFLAALALIAKAKAKDKQ